MFFKNNYCIAFIAALGGLLFGYDSGVISGVLPLIKQEFSLSTINQEIIVSSIIIGALLGSLFSGWLVDKLGRRKMLIVAACGFIIGTTFTIITTTISEIIVGRFIVGCAIGITSYTTPLFIAEHSPTTTRGTLVLVNAVTISGGEALAFLANYVLTPYSAWRWMFAIGILPALLFISGMLFLSETGVWLSKKKKENLPWKLLFSKEIRPILWISLCLGCFQQFFGINTVMYYGPTLFNSIGYLDSSAQLLITLLMGLVNTLFSIVCFYYIDKVGRRFLLLNGSLLAGICLFLIATIIPFIQKYPLLQPIAVICFVLYIAGYCISVGSLFWLLIAEIFPLSVRGLGMSLSAAVQWGANFCVSMSFLSLIEWLGAPLVFMLYGSVCGACFIFCYYKIPETSQIPLANMSRHLKNIMQKRIKGTLVS